MQPLPYPQMDQQEPTVGEMDKLLTREELKNLLRDVRGSFLPAVVFLHIASFLTAQSGHNRLRSFSLARPGPGPATTRSAAVLLPWQPLIGKRLEEVVHNRRDL